MLPRRTKTSLRSPRSISDPGFTSNHVAYLDSATLFARKLLAFSAAWFRSSGASGGIRLCRWLLAVVDEALRVALGLILGFGIAVAVIFSSFDVWFPVLLKILKLLVRILVSMIAAFT